MLERRRAVALAHHYHAFEGLSIRQIADRLGRSPATIKTYFFDPTGEKAQAVRARYVGLSWGCGAYTQPRNGKGDALAYCEACDPGAIEPRWSCQRVLDAMRGWRGRYSRLPSPYDWSRIHARVRGGEALERRATVDWPSACLVGALFGDSGAARAAVGRISPGGLSSARNDPGRPSGWRPNEPAELLGGGTGSRPRPARAWRGRWPTS